jgi:hypothetical protein
VKLFKNFILKELIRASTAMKANIDTLQTDVLKKGVNGYLDKNLTKAQKVDPKSCIAYSNKYSWDEVASNFISSVTTAYS